MKAEYLMKSLTHRDRVFFWQHTASIIIVIVVLIIVLSGLFLSYLHFYKDLKSQDQIAVVGTEIELNFKGLKITSSLIGLLILVLSIAFLYLYLVYVFPEFQSVAGNINLVLASQDPEGKATSKNLKKATGENSNPFYPSTFLWNQIYRI